MNNTPGGYPLPDFSNLTVGSAMNLTYTFPAGSNNGKISSQSDSISGETVTYQYDSLNRLLSASSNKGWSETYGFDGFGNLLSKTPTGGAPTLSQAVNASTNRIVGQNYDANGNQTSSATGTLTYDAENRVLIAASAAIQYGYDSRNKRVWSATISGGYMTQTVSFYGVDGQKLGGYLLQVVAVNNQVAAVADTGGAASVYFGGKRVGAATDTGGIGAFTQDRLGSNGSYYPYGEARGTVPQDAVGFATYTNDSASGLQYADQRYYANNWGRFLSPDPYRASAGPRDPASWNRYSYVEGDPINYGDRLGLFVTPEEQGDGPTGGGSSGDDLGGGGCWFGLDYGEDLTPCVPFPTVGPGAPTVGGGGGGRLGAEGQQEGQSIHQGSTRWDLAQQAMEAAKASLAELFTAPPSPECAKDLAAVGVTAQGVSAAAGMANIIDGMTAVGSTYAQDIYGDSPLFAAAAAQYGGMNMIQFMTLNSPNAAAVAQIFGDNIYVNPAWVNGMSSVDQEAMLLHEILHNLTGKDDATIQKLLGLPSNAASQNIGDKLKADCLQ